jgi:predicted dehydrogenase
VVTDLRAAVVGTGFIAAVHVDALRRLGIEIAGMVGSSPERARERAAEAGLPPAYESFEAMLADPDVDVVHITSPNHLHEPQARAVLAAGKHVVCEKPLGLDPGQTAGLVELARASGLVHAVAFNIRFYPQVQEAAARVREGTLGDVRLISGGYLQDWLLLDTDWNWRLDPAVGGALRAVGDIGSHWIDLMTFVTGQRVEAVCADLTTFVPVRRAPVGPVQTFAAAAGGESVEHVMETEDAAGLLLRLNGGARAVATISQVSPGRKNLLSFEIDGSRSSVAWRSERPEELWAGHRDRPNETLLRDASLMTAPGAAATRLPAGHSEGFADTFRELCRTVYAAVAAGGPPDHPAYPTFADGHEQALIGAAIARSAAQARWVAVDEIREETRRT